MCSRPGTTVEHLYVNGSEFIVLFHRLWSVFKAWLLIWLSVCFAMVRINTSLNLSLYVFTFTLYVAVCCACPYVFVGCCNWCYMLTMNIASLSTTLVHYFCLVLSSTTVAKQEFIAHVYYSTVISWILLHCWLYGCIYWIFLVHSLCIVWLSFGFLSVSRYCQRIMEYLQNNPLLLTAAFL